MMKVKDSVHNWMAANPKIASFRVYLYIIDSRVHTMILNQYNTKSSKPDSCNHTFYMFKFMIMSSTH